MSSRGVLRRSTGGSPQIIGRHFPASKSLLGACGSSSTPSTSSLVLLSWMSLSVSTSDSGVNRWKTQLPVGGSRLAILASRRDTTSTGNLYTKLLKKRENIFELWQMLLWTSYMKIIYEYVIQCSFRENFLHCKTYLHFFVVNILQEMQRIRAALPKQIIQSQASLRCQVTFICRQWLFALSKNCIFSY